jgi:hypothetical protein
VPEVLNFTSATAKLGSHAANAYAAQAATRPLAGLGAGAFTFEGAQAGLGASNKVAALALPRMRDAFAAATSQVGAQAHDRGCGASQPGSVASSTVASGTASTSTISVMARINPVTPGGLGPHPAREPEPV